MEKVRRETWLRGLMLASVVAVLRSSEAETHTMLTTDAGAFCATLTARVMGGKLEVRVSASEREQNGGGPRKQVHQSPEMFVALRAEGGVSVTVIWLGRCCPGSQQRGDPRYRLHWKT